MRVARLVFYGVLAIVVELACVQGARAQAASVTFHIDCFEGDMASTLDAADQLCAARLHNAGWSAAISAQVTDGGDGCSVAFLDTQNGYTATVAVHRSDGQVCSAPIGGSAATAAYMLPPFSAEEGHQVGLAMLAVMLVGWCCKVVSLSLFDRKVASDE